MEISHRIENGICVIDVADKLTRDKTKNLQSYAVALLSQDIKALLFNVSDSKKIDSDGLGTLMLVSKRATEHEVQFAICSPNNYTSMILDVTSIDKILSVYQTEEEALSALAG
ncbi:MAG: STAS domain-containing protein [SAR324 cluster bacterium]|nr:STAS domain-containing protein [SAR324 cluster bacterium]